uniref:Uncharacterized protein n=1 Tax=Moniliophthora roreri TaxID=221103 RepID=A0A0W0FZF9_MONRR
METYSAVECAQLTFVQELARTLRVVELHTYLLLYYSSG